MTEDMTEVKTALLIAQLRQPFNTPPAPSLHIQWVNGARTRRGGQTLTPPVDFSVSKRKISDKLSLNKTKNQTGIGKTDPVLACGLEEAATITVRKMLWKVIGWLVLEGGHHHHWGRDLGKAYQAGTASKEDSVFRLCNQGVRRSVFAPNRSTRQFYILN